MPKLNIDALPRFPGLSDPNKADAIFIADCGNRAVVVLEVVEVGSIAESVPCGGTGSRGLTD